MMSQRAECFGIFFMHLWVAILCPVFVCQNLKKYQKTIKKLGKTTVSDSDQKYTYLVAVRRASIRVRVAVRFGNLSKNLKHLVLRFFQPCYLLNCIVSKGTTKFFSAHLIAWTAVCLWTNLPVDYNWWWGYPFYLKFWVNRPADFEPIIARSASAVRPSKKVRLTLLKSPLRAF